MLKCCASTRVDKADKVVDRWSGCCISMLIVVLIILLILVIVV